MEIMGEFLGTITLTFRGEGGCGGWICTYCHYHALRPDDTYERYITNKRHSN